MKREQALEFAAQLWCDERNSYKVMDSEMAESIAELLQEVAGPVGQLRIALAADPDYARTWHDNLACCVMDEGVPHDVANRAAARFMRLAFKVKTDCHDLVPG
jgi:hypothetical protein